MLESWPTQTKLGELTLMPHAWLKARAAESQRTDVAGFEVPTQAGTFGVIASAHGVTAVLFPGFDAAAVAGRIRGHGLAWGSTGRQVAIEAGVELMSYLLGATRELRTPVDMRHLSPFLRDVYGALREVPYGATVTYGELAALAGHPTKARAVGQAMHRNPVPIFVPCHRVVQAGGGLGGWSGPIGWKERLLLLEGAAPRKRSLQTRRSR